MNRYIQFLLFLFLSFCLKTSFGEKYALLVGINNYGDIRPSLQGPVNDVRAINEALLYNDFKKENVTVLTNAAATARNFYYGFEYLMRKVQDGDVIMIHFSGYETSLDSGGILLYDAGIPEAGLLVLLENLSDKIPHGTILVTLDRCFTFMNGNTNSLHFKNNNIAIFSADAPNEHAYEDELNSRGEMMGRFSAAVSEVLLTLDDNITYNDFIQKVTKTVTASSSENAPGAKVEYKGIVSNLKSATNQHPYSLSFIPNNRLLFNGEFNKGLPHLYIREITGPASFVLAKGKSSGVLNGTKVAITLAGQPKSESNILAYGTVNESEDFMSRVTLDKALFAPTRGIASDDDYLPSTEKYWVYITESGYFNSKVHLYVKNNDRQLYSGREVKIAYNFIIKKTVYYWKKGEVVHVDSVQPKLKKGDKITVEIDKALGDFKNYTVVHNINDADLIVDSIYYEYVGREVFYHCILRDAVSNSVFKNVNGLDSLLPVIKAFWRYNFIRDLSNNNAKLDVKFEAIVIRDGKPDSTALIQNNVLYTGDKVGLHVTNSTPNGLYFNVIDITPDGNYSVLLPNNNPRSYNYYPLSKCFLPPYGESYFYTKYPLEISPPYGNEILKIFVSDRPMDVSNLFENTNYGATRGVDNSKPLILENMGIYSWQFKIKDKFFDDGNNTGIEISGNNVQFEGKDGRPVEDGYWHTKEPLHWHFKNPTGTDVYYNLLSIDENNNISVIYPNSSYNSLECVVPVSDEQNFSLPESKLGMIDYYTYYSDQPFDLKSIFDNSTNKISTFAYLLSNKEVPGTMQALKTKANHFTMIAGADTEKSIGSRGGNDPCIRIFDPTYISCDETRGLDDYDAPENTVRVKISGLVRMPDAKTKISKVKVGNIYLPADDGYFRGEIELHQENTNVDIEAEGVRKTIAVHVNFDSIFKQTTGVNHFIGVGIDSLPLSVRNEFTILSTAVNDVDSVAQLLKDKYDFKEQNIHLLFNGVATKTNIMDSISNLQVQPNDNVVIYLAGHGHAGLKHPENNYCFIPADIQRPEGSMFKESSALLASDIATSIKDLGAKHIILIVDACNAGVLVKSLQFTFLQLPSSAASHWILTSTSSDVKADDIYVDHNKVSSNSPLAEALLENLRSCSDPEGIKLQSGLLPYITVRMKQLIGTKPKNQEPETKCLFGEEDFAFRPVK